MSNCLASTRPILTLLACCLVALGALAQDSDSAPTTAKANFRVTGIVVSKIDGHPLEHARVLLRDVRTRNEPQSFVTAQDGKFAFEHVSAGKFALEGIKRGFIPAAYNQHDQYSTAIVTGADLNTEDLILKLSPEAIISGKVLDEAGEPVRHALVMLYCTNHFQGVDQIQGCRNAQTDDLGAYELTSLQPGTYFLSVRAQPWYAFHTPPTADRAGSSQSGGGSPEVDPSLDVAYPVTYHENATETDAATPIQIRGGERLQIEMNLSPVPALRLIFHVAENQTHGYAFPQLEQTVFDGPTYVQATPQMISPGVIELSGIPAGRYNIRIPGENTAQLNGIELNKDGEEIDTSTAEAVGNVNVLVRVPGEPTIPNGLMVGLFHARTAIGGFQSVGPQGEAEIPQVPAGTYQVQVAARNKQYAVVGLSADGAQVTGHTVTLPAGASAKITLTLGIGVDLQGSAKKAGKPFAAAMVVLVPKNPEGNRDLFRRDQSDLDGTFSLRGVVPGAYTLVAIEDGWDLDWSQPEIIAPYVKRGQSIVVHGETSSPMRVKDAIEVQSK